MEKQKITIWSKRSCLVVIIIIMSLAVVPGWTFIKKGVLSGGYKALPATAYILLLPAAYFMSVFVHELGHFISFIKNGIKVRALFLSIFLFNREENNWRLKICPNSVTLLGGAAIPDVSAVKDKEEFEHLRSAYARVIAAGPTAAIAFYIIVQLVAFPIFLQQENVFLQLFFSVISLYMSVITVFLLLISMADAETIIGDIPALHLCQANPSFAAMQMYQYSALSSNPDEVRRNSHYLREMILKDIEKMLYRKDIGVVALNSLDIFIMEYLTGDSDNIPQVIMDYISMLMYSPAMRKKIPHSEVGTYLWFHVVILLSSMEASREKALEEYDFLVNNIDLKDPMNSYLMRQAQHALGLADHSDYLSNRSNIRASSAHGMWKYFEGYYSQEIKLNRFILSSIPCKDHCFI
ncbi:MAG TPA: hypothetical protein GX505_09675 [Clostridiales bacterium]|nr:hypothetical protein [Clostridiales bacterium]